MSSEKLICAFLYHDRRLSSTILHRKGFENPLRQRVDPRVSFRCKFERLEPARGRVLDSKELDSSVELTRNFSRLIGSRSRDEEGRMDTLYSDAVRHRSSVDRSVLDGPVYIRSDPFDGLRSILSANQLFSGSFRD